MDQEALLAGTIIPSQSPSQRDSSHLNTHEDNATSVVVSFPPKVDPTSNAPKHMADPPTPPKVVDLFEAKPNLDMHKLCRLSWNPAHIIRSKSRACSKRLEKRLKAEGFRFER